MDKPCEGCGFSVAAYVECPFLSAIHKQHERHWLCGQCVRVAKDAVMEIERARLDLATQGETTDEP